MYPKEKKNYHSKQPWDFGGIEWRMKIYLLKIFQSNLHAIISSSNPINCKPILIFIIFTKM